MPSTTEPNGVDARPDPPVEAARREFARRMSTLLASAQRLTKQGTVRPGKSATWQDDAWDMYDLVGPLRFLSVTLAGRMAQARLYVGRVSDDPLSTPEPVEDEAVTGLLDAIGGSPGGRAEIVNRLGVHLFIAGEGWLAGIPRRLLPESQAQPETLDVDQVRARPPGRNGYGSPATPGVSYDPAMPPPRLDDLLPPASLSVDDLEWRALSVSEVKGGTGGNVTIMLGERDDEKLTVSADEIVLIRVWRPHPRRAWEADSPTRSNLAVLRELVGLDMHVASQVDSRLAGAGILLIPQSAQRSLAQAAGLSDDDDTDQFTEALLEAMLVPIKDRGSASAIVPLVVTIPDEAIDGVKHLSFVSPLDAEARGLREDDLRRLGVGLDAPPEVLLGTGGMNHWGAWLVHEETVGTHLLPPLSVICLAWTTQYLWPVLIDQGWTPEAARELVIWADVSDLATRPNQSQDAMALHERGAISDKALRDATGFDADDAPLQAELPLAAAMALTMARQTPSLTVDPGLPALVAQITAVLEGDIPNLLDLAAAQEAAAQAQAEAVAAAPASGAEPGEGDGGGAAPGQQGNPKQPPSGGIPATDADPARVPSA